MSIEGQGNFLTLAQCHIQMKIKLAFLSNHWAILSQSLNVSLSVHHRFKFIFSKQFKLFEPHLDLYESLYDFFAET